MQLAPDIGTLMLSVDQFCDLYLQPDEVLRRDAAHQPPYDLLPHLAERGLIRVPLPQEDGGYGMGWTQFCLVQERIGRSAYFAASILNRVICFGIMPLLNHGSSEQKAEILPDLLEGKALCALGLNEADAGSDARNVQSTAVRVDGGWLLNGEKVWISDAKASKYLLTLAKVDGAFLTLLTPLGSAGITMEEMEKAGNNCMPTWRIGMKNVFVPERYQMGKVGDGLRNILSTLRYSRASQAATAVGCAQAALDLAMSHAKSRIQFGQPLAALQVVKHKLVDMHVEVTKARLLVRELARKLDAGEECADVSSMTKITASETLQFVTNHGMQIMASAGYSIHSHMQRYWRDARLFTFGEGANEVQKELIARTLGL
jgi:alkylation response protein AidB-like acyl-CoA dehydrogenase